MRVSGGQQSNSSPHTCTRSSPDSLPSRLPPDTGQSSCALQEALVGWLSILNIAVYASSLEPSHYFLNILFLRIITLLIKYFCSELFLIESTEKKEGILLNDPTTRPA